MRARLLALAPGLLALACASAEPEPTPAVCGDGVVAGTEACDDGNADDGDACKTDCTANVCGDGALQLGVEACDDGNADDGDACKADCTPNVCGDGAVQLGVETCDDGNREDGDACKADCTPNVCGDGVVNVGVEACDDANDDPTDGCDACQDLRCGGGVWAEGPTGLGNLDLAGDFTVPTTDGPWSLREHWTGCDDVVFVLHTTRSTYASALWASSLYDLITASPPNVHYVFLSYDANAAEVVAEKALDAEDVYWRLDPEAERQWRHRLHFVDRPVGSFPGWLLDTLQERSVISFAIDRQRRYRSVGLLQNPGGRGGPQMDWLLHELDYFAFEAEREARLAADPPDQTVTVFDDTTLAGGWQTSIARDVVLPSASEMAGFGRMDLDLEMSCPDGDESACPDWDHTAKLFVCGPPSARCGDGTMDEGEACDDGNTVAGDGCSAYCEAETGPARACPGAVELGRWITTYKRIGRWVTDASPMLAWLREGGPRRFMFRTNTGEQAYVLNLGLRLHAAAADAPRPVEVQPVTWPGGRYDADYNGRQPRFWFEVPAGTRKVELVSLITGHGFGVERANCAEFCNHTHHFAVDGGPETVRAHPEAGTAEGCLQRIGEGVVPNQFGTWPFGRGGWCPGFDVPAFVVDLTDQLTTTASHSLDYRALFEGRAPYVPQPSGGTDGFAGSIDLRSYLVFSR